MILSRVIEHIKHEHWTGALIELVIVIVGIFVGLQANNWNTMRHQRQAESELVGELRVNLALEIDIKTHSVKYTEHLIHNLEDAIAVVQGMKHSQSLSPEECKTIWQSGIVMNSSFDNATLFALLTPSQLKIIRDSKLRTALLTYGGLHQRTVQFIDHVKSTFITVADKYPNLLPRRLDLHKHDLSSVACNLKKIRASQALQNNLLSNLGRTHGIFIADKQDLAQIKQLTAKVDGYRP